MIASIIVLIITVPINFEFLSNVKFLNKESVIVNYLEDLWCAFFG